LSTIIAFNVTTPIKLAIATGELKIGFLPHSKAAGFAEIFAGPTLL
jgi:hypothetical protein